MYNNVKKFIRENIQLIDDFNWKELSQSEVKELEFKTALHPGAASSFSVPQAVSFPFESKVHFICKTDKSVKLKRFSISKPDEVFCKRTGANRRRHSSIAGFGV